MIETAFLRRLFQAVDDMITVPAMKERLNFLKEVIEQIQQENSTLKDENAILKDKASRVDDLEKELSELKQFKDLGIVKIKLDNSGKRITNCCYCPQCGGIIHLEQYLNGEDRKRNGYISLFCQKKCGYSARLDEIDQVLKQWDETHYV